MFDAFVLTQVNNLIGSQLCAQHTTEQMKLIFASTVFHTDSNTVSLSDSIAMVSIF